MTIGATAQASFLGYEYQALQALLLIVPSGSNSQVYIERFDDVVFEQGEHREIIQNKYSLNDESTITAMDPALWKTLKNWIHLIKIDAVSSEDYEFRIITTRKSDDPIILELTEESELRDNEQIIKELLEIAKKIDNVKINKFVEEFTTFDSGKRFNLIKKMQILTSQPNIQQIQTKIESHLEGYTHIRFKDNFFDAIYGWWYRQIINRLSVDVNKPLTSEDLLSVIRRNRDLQTAEALPIHFDHVELSKNILDTYLQNRFVEQLNSIDLDNTSIFESILNYYKAFEQRGKWVRELNDISDRLDDYDEELLLKWKSEFNSIGRIIEKLDITDNEELKNHGMKLFEWMEKSDYYPDLKLENSISKIWLWRGSFHMLSNECRLVLFNIIVLLSKSKL
jgi:hypothetical protein